MWGTYRAGLALLAALARALASAPEAVGAAAPATGTGLLVSSSSCSLLWARSGGLTQPTARTQTASTSSYIADATHAKLCALKLVWQGNTA